MERVKKYGLLIVSLSLIGCGGLTPGKREASRPVIAALQRANQERDKDVLRNMELDQASAEMLGEERAGDPSNAADIKLAQDIRSCRDSLISYGMGTEPGVKAEMARESDECVRILTATVE